MRPLKVTISAWGSYKDKVEVDFRKFHQGSLFLITGPTGAGKTTVFDAISFALFGDVSGKTRDKGTVRSDFATTEDTFVELLFEHKGIEYRVNRAPKYERPKKRGEGTTISQETAELYIEGQNPIVVITEVNKKIEELLSMTYQQFKQISMIAQGEFLELLVASSKERVEILRNIFKTNQYDQLQKSLTERSLRLQKLLVEQNNRLDEVISTIDTSNAVMNQEQDTEKNELEELLSTSPYHFDRILILLKESITQSKKLEAEFNKRIAELEIQEKDYIERIAKAEKCNEDHRRLRKLQEELISLYNQKEEYKDKQTKLKRALQARNVDSYDRIYTTSVERYTTSKANWEQIKVDLEKTEPEYEACKEEFKDIDSLEKALLDYQMNYQKIEGYRPSVLEVSELKKRVVVSQEIVNTLNKQQEELESSLKSTKEQLILAKQESERYEEVEIEIEQNKANREKLQLKRVRLQAIKEKNDILSEIILEKKRYTEVYTKEESEYLQAKKSYDEMEMQYRRAFLGIVARDLEEGKPCPVCGSTTHPKKATVGETAPSEKELEQLKSVIETKTQVYQEHFSKLSAIAEKINTLQGDLDKTCEDVGVDIRDLMDKLVEVNHDYESLLNDAQQLDKDLFRKNELKQAIMKLEDATKLQQEKSIQINNQYSLQVQQVAQLKEQITNKQAALPKEYQNLEQITAALYELESVITKQKNKIQTLRTTFDKVKTRYERLLALKAEREDEMRKIHSQSKSEKEALGAALVKYGFESREEYCQASMQEEEYRILEKELQEYIDQCKEKEAQTKTLMETIGKEKEVDTTSLKEEKEKILLQKSELLEQTQINHTKQTVNRKAYQSMKEKLEKKVQLEQEYGVIKQLDNVAKGNNPDRLVFEQYVLASYFEDILQAANLRLLKMTNSRYELMRSTQINDARKKDSLDIEVLDHYTGKNRSVKSLSGGESFKAALSLALGMSDIIQNYAGGIEVDTLFIDEGFGSLDAESLEQALETLISLTQKNRLIGIISHVSELKEKINNQILVERGNQGSTLVMKTQ